MDYRTLNPTTGQLVESYDTVSDAEMDRAVASCAAAYDSWRGLSVSERTAPLRSLADLLESRADELARTMALEMGKPLVEGRAEAAKCAWGCRYYAEQAPAMLAPRERESDGTAARVRYDPLGPLLAIMPWNYPFWQFYRFAAPALCAGNAVLLKHAPGTPRCALAIESLMTDAGFPRGLVRSLFLTDAQAGELIADPRVRGVTLTGSTRAGRQVAARAGRELKPLVLELGGSDPFIVLDDADPARAAEVGVTARCLNSGQSCIGAKRFLVQREIYDDFAKGLVERMSVLRMGDPSEPGVELGPMAREDLRDRLHDQVRRTIDAGARALCGAELPPGPGFFYPPTVLDRVAPGTPAATEELFGPVAALFPVADDAEALRLANATEYGLGASVWTASSTRAERFVRDIEAGSVFVNGLVKSDPRLPFGGVKASGFGRELSREGLLEFVNVKTVWVG